MYTVKSISKIANIYPLLPGRLRSAVLAVSRPEASRITELRLRRSRPLCVTADGREYALSQEKCRRVLTTSTYTTGKTEYHPDGIELYSLVSVRMQGYWVDCDRDGGQDADVLGGKTGFTDEAGYAIELIVSYKKHTYLCITTKSADELKALEDNIAICENYILPKDDSEE